MKSFKCDLCKNKVYKEKWRLNEHNKWNHSTTPLPVFACNLCPKTYIRKSQLKYHITTFHHNQRPFSCKKCPLTHTSKSRLSRHVEVVHLKIRQTCKICAKLFCSKEALSRHIETVHHGTKPFACSSCP